MNWQTPTPTDPLGGGHPMYPQGVRCRCARRQSSKKVAAGMPTRGPERDLMSSCTRRTARTVSNRPTIVPVPKLGAPFGRTREGQGSAGPAEWVNDGDAAGRGLMTVRAALPAVGCAHGKVILHRARGRRAQSGKTARPREAGADVAVRYLGEDSKARSVRGPTRTHHRDPTRGRARLRGA